MAAIINWELIVYNNKMDIIFVQQLCTQNNPITSF